MMRKIARAMVGASAAGLMAMAGCGAGPSGSAAGTTAGAAAVGATQTLAGDSTSLVVTVHDVVKGTQNARIGGRAVPVTNQLVSVDAEVCLHGFNGTVRASDRWQLVDAASGRYGPEPRPAEGLKPAYPYASENVLDGECVRGWISFLTEKDPVVTVRYATETGHTLRWDIN